MDTEETIPATLDEIEALVQALYQPALPIAISNTQSTLQKVQRSTKGWEVAREFLSRDDPNVKFFGALTLIVKLNTESSLLTDEEAWELLHALLDWFMRHVDDHGSHLVVRKLASALVAFFLRFNKIWSYCVHDIVQSLAFRRVTISSGDPSSPPECSHLLEHLGVLDIAQFRAVLWFTELLAEDIMKIDINSPMHCNLHTSVAANLPLISQILSYSFSAAMRSLGLESASVHIDAIKSFQIWVFCIQRIASRDEDLLSRLRPLASCIIESVPDEGVFDAAIETITDILSHYPGFLLQDHYTAIIDLFGSEWASKRYHDLLEGSYEFDTVSLANLMLAFGDARLQVLVQGADQASQMVLSRICGLLSAPGSPAVDDKIFVPVVEFWSNFIEVLTDTIYSEDCRHEEWARVAMRHVHSTIRLCWHKIMYPPDYTGSWDQADRAGFSEARKDVADLLQASYALMGCELISIFASAVVRALTSASWVELEALAFCLGSLADCTHAETSIDASLEHVFSTPFFLSLLPSMEMPWRTRQTCAMLIEKYSDYFQRNPTMLPQALNILFDLLNDPHATLAASKSIHRLCRSCRTHLTPEVGTFIHRYKTLATATTLDCQSGERVIGAVAAVLQSLEDPLIKMSGLEHLLELVQLDITTGCKVARHVATDTELYCLQSHKCALDGPDTSPGLHFALRGLRCLVSIGKGLQAPGEGPIELDPESLGPLSPPEGSHLWKLQGLVLSLVIEVSAAFPASGEVVEAICNMLRTGFAETAPGLFVFEPDRICWLLTRCDSSTPELGVILNTACSFICSPTTDQGGGGDTKILQSIVSWVMSLLNHSTTHEDDTEISQHGIDLMTRLIVRHPEILLDPTTAHWLEFFLLFTLRVLDGCEPLPKSAAAGFWTTIITLRVDDHILREQLQNLVISTGPALTRSIMFNIGGKASRSELDKISEPLKKLIANQPRAKVWIEQALADASFPGIRISIRDKLIFVKRIASLRGSRATNQIIRDFWLAARGANFAYAS